MIKYEYRARDCLDTWALPKANLKEEEKSDINTQRQRRGKLNMFLKNDLSSEEEKKTVMMRRLVLVAKGFSSPIS